MVAEEETGETHTQHASAAKLAAHIIIYFITYSTYLNYYYGPNTITRVTVKPMMRPFIFHVEA